MAYTLEFDAGSSLVRLTHSGPVDLSELRLARAEAAVALQRHRAVRLLVDVSRMETTLSTSAHFEFTSSHPNLLSRCTKIAVVVTPQVAADGVFVENVAVNRGMRLRVFMSIDAAIEWLSAPDE